MNIANPLFETNHFEHDVLSGLDLPQKSIPCRWLYDHEGSKLFEMITQLDEYYPTRTELSIFEQCIDEITSMIGSNVSLIEYGAGASTKTTMLFDKLESLQAYIPVDISEEFLNATAIDIKKKYTDLAVYPVAANFLKPIDIPDTLNSKLLGFFPGSTIGNLSNNEIESFLTTARRQLGDSGSFLLGYDLIKSLSVLLPAYNDARGITAKFNLNLLRRINRELNATFELDKFKHEARWNLQDACIEMHIVSTITQDVSIAGHTINFLKGESIHTENSRKFAIDWMTDICSDSGWKTKKVWTDKKSWFAVSLMVAE